MEQRCHWPVITLDRLLRPISAEGKNAMQVEFSIDTHVVIGLNAAAQDFRLGRRTGCVCVCV